MKKPLRIAMIGQRSLPAEYGGVERAVEELGARLVERGHEVTAFCWSADNPPSTYRGIKLKPVRALSGKHLRAFSQSISAAMKVLFGKYDVVHIHAMGPGLAIPLLKLRPGLRIVATAQGRDDKRSKWGPTAQKIIHFGAWASAKFSDGVIVVSLDLQADYLREFGRESSFVPNGIVLPELSPASDKLAEFGLIPNGYLLNVGRIVPEKGVDMIPHAYAAEKFPLPLVVVGASASTDAYVAAISESLPSDGSVRLIGAHRGETLRQLFLNARGFVFPSHLEGLPIVLLEAISFGLPLVCSNIGPVTQVIGTHSAPGRHIFNDADDAGLRQAIWGLLNEDEAIARSAAKVLQEQTSKDFSWDRVTDLTEIVYETVTGTSHEANGTDDVRSYIPQASSSK
jgi:glycosyltransferase involved in cell wall biosynthesis